MASVSFISTSKLTSLLNAADPQKALLVRVLSPTRLSLETDAFRQVSIIDLAEEKVLAANFQTGLSIAPSKKSRRSGTYQLSAFGETVEAYSLPDILSAGLKALEETRPGTLMKLSKVKKLTKRIVAQNPSDLFSTADLAEKHSRKLVDGWWYGTNNSAKETNTWLQLACEIAGVKWGSDFATSF